VPDYDPNNMPPLPGGTEDFGDGGGWSDLADLYGAIDWDTETDRQQGIGSPDGGDGVDFDREELLDMILEQSPMSKYEGLEPTGGISHDGTPLFWTKPEGERSNYSRISLGRLQGEMITHFARLGLDSGLVDEIMNHSTGDLGFTWSGGTVSNFESSDGNVAYQNDENGNGTRAGNRTTGSNPPPAPGGGGGSNPSTGTGSPNGTQDRSANPDPNAGGGNADGSVDNPSDPGQPGNQPGDLPPVGGSDPSGGDTGVTVGPIDDPGRGSRTELESIFDFLPANFNDMTPEQRMNALIGGITRAQEQSRDVAVSGLDAAQAERQARTAGRRALESRILGDTDVMSEADIQRISGRTTDVANQKANVLAQALGERRAAMGSARSGSAQTEQSAVMTNAMQQAIQAESDTRAQARRENFASRNQALGAVTGSQTPDLQLGAALAGNKADVIGNYQQLGDAFMSANLLNREQPNYVGRWDSSGNYYRERVN